MSTTSTTTGRLVRRIVRTCATFAAAVTCLSTPWTTLEAQGPVKQEPVPSAGWVFTPGITVAETFDNNVLLATEGSESAGDFLTAVSPRGALAYRGRRDTLQMDYRGSFLLYQELSDLNAYDQRSTTDFRHRVTRDFTLFARNGISKSPSTDEIELPGILFRRQGVLLEDLRAGAETHFGARTSLMTAYTFQWVDFDQGSLPVDTPITQGGHSQGAVAVLSHALSSRLSIGGDYDLRYATMNDGRAFDVQNALATVDYRLSQRLFLSGGAGFAWLATDEAAGNQMAPAFRADISGTGSRLAWNAGYRRSFLPSFGFGGTFQNEELHGNVLAPLTRRIDLSGGIAIRENEPLEPTDRNLRSVWLRSSVSYLANRWIRIEGFYALTFQDSQRPGGKVNRARLGVQVVTSKRMRLR